MLTLMEVKSRLLRRYWVQLLSRMELKDQIGRWNPSDSKTWVGNHPTRPIVDMPYRGRLSSGSAGDGPLTCVVSSAIRGIHHRGERVIRQHLGEGMSRCRV